MSKKSNETVKQAQQKAELLRQEQEKAEMLKREQQRKENEYRNCVRERERLNNQIDSRKANNATIQGQVERLERAYDEMAKIKGNKKDKKYDNAYDVKRKCQSSELLGEDCKWYGAKKDKFDDIVDTDLEKAASDFYDSIDDILDEINTKLADKRSELDSGNAILNGLVRSLNNISARIRNFRN